MKIQLDVSKAQALKGMNHIVSTDVRTLDFSFVLQIQFLSESGVVYWGRSYCCGGPCHIPQLGQWEIFSENTHSVIEDTLFLVMPHPKWAPWSFC